MSPTLEFLNILGAAALLLWGLRMIKAGVMRAFGAELRQWIAKGTKNRLTSAFWGFAATLALQSSTAIAVITASFAARDFLTLSAAQAIMLGANLGTAIVALILSTNVTGFASVAILIGVAMSMSARKIATKGMGKAVLGLGLMLLALQMMDAATEPLRQAPVVVSLLGALEAAPLLAVLIAAGLAVLSSSSLAVIVLAVVLAGGQVISPTMSIYMVAGANLGGAIPPFLATMAEGTAARRLTLANLIVRAIGAIALMSFAGPFASLVLEVVPDPRSLPAIAHILFNVILLIVFLPLIDPVNRLVRHLVPDLRREDDDRPAYLDNSLLDTPELALAVATRETLRLGDMVGRMLDLTGQMLADPSEDDSAEIIRLEQRVDKLHEAIKLYVARLSGTELDEVDRRRADEIISYAINLEHAGDIIESGLDGRIAKKSRNQLSLSEEGLAEIRGFFEHTHENLQMAQAIFLSRDLTLAQKLMQAKVDSRRIEEQSADRHIARLREGSAQAIETSSIHLDILRDLKRINAHFASVAYPILDESALLQDSRMKRQP